MQCAAYGLSTDRLIPHPFNLCSNAGSTHASISQIQPLDMTLSTGTQLLWSSMTRTILSVLLNCCMVLATVSALSFRVFL
ncbi:unnamed protein product [Staurois parvus]|uniref:Uncharacterized protein n=1 Tax=Staurois parvus TaxID=386267 RepID=A0ABN9GRF9_9NEOB|nr:unnamed protein product [Staurois parvus]